MNYKSLFASPPQNKEYEVMSTLIEQAAEWRRIGDTHLENRIWEMIKDRATLYMRGDREIDLRTKKP